MPSTSAINSNLNLEQLWAQQSLGASQGTPQGTGSANDAFAALFQAAMGNPAQAQTTAATSSASSTSAASDFSALGQALASNNLSAAQQAFQSLQTDLQGAQEGGKAHHHHHHAQASGEASQTPAVQASGASDASTGTSTGGASTTTPDAQLLSLLLGSM
jgi:hypothetical protein